MIINKRYIIIFYLKLGGILLTKFVIPNTLSIDSKTTCDTSISVGGVGGGVIVLLLVVEIAVAVVYFPAFSRRSCNILPMDVTPFPSIPHGNITDVSK